MTAGHYETF